MTDKPTNEEPPSESRRDRAPQSGDRSTDPRFGQRNLANRLFPGPSKPMSNRQAGYIEGLLKSLDGDPAKAWRNRAASRSAADDGSQGARHALQARRPAVAEPPAGATPEDIAKLSDKLEEQNELLRAILASSVDTQADARSTAQNSRTFAWAGTVIALFTLIAAVISIITAVRAG